MAREEKISLILQELVRRSNEESRRLRSLEQRLFSIDSRIKSLESSTTLYSRKTSEKLTSFEASIKLQEEISMKLRATIDKLSKQADKYARKSDIKEMEKMFDLLSPVAQQFATRKDLDELRRRMPVSA